jgi:hypothetical protein
MSDHPREPEAMIDAYLDGQLDADERRRFEAALDDRPELRREVEHQRRIDAAITRAMDVPPADALRPIVAAAQRRHERAVHRTPWARSPLAIAASLLLALGGVWMMVSVLAPRPGPDRYAIEPWKSVETTYHERVAAGFEPDVICADDDEFERWFLNRFRRPLRLAALPDAAEALGLGYGNTITPATIYILAEVDGARIIVFVDRLNRGREPELTEGSGLRLFKGAVGDLALYEVSPLAEARLLPHFYHPDDARGSKGGDG